jgi:signal transduction histidine kinase
MKERMALLNGTLEIQTGDRGTIIRAGVPLETGKAKLTNRANAGRS